MNGSNFYEDLPVLERYDSTTDRSQYRPLPGDWYLALTDVVDSTRAVESGRYKQVNILGAATIMTLLNITGYNRVPYVFGGDGAIVAVPPGTRSEVRRALSGLRRLGREEFDLSVRAALIPVEELRSEDGVDVLVGRHRISPHLTQGHFAGGGVERAEEWVKSGEDGEYLIPVAPDVQHLDVTGLECRWEKIPAHREEIVSILVKVRDPDSDRRSNLYRDVIETIEDIYGNDETARPIHAENLRVTRSRDDLLEEVRVRTHGTSRLWRWIYSTGLWILAHVGFRLMKYGIPIGDANWGQYRDVAVQNTDFRKFNDRVMQVLSGSSHQRERLVKELEKRRKKGDLVYGIHASDHAYLTCLVSNYNTRHFHLVDGADGGYSKAAAQLKEQLDGPIGTPAPGS